MKNRESMVRTIEDIKRDKLIIYECISGSKAYGLALPTSDTDIKGVFVLSQKDYFGLNYIEQINNESSDIVFYELKRFIDLLIKNNPNVLDLLATPEDCILYKHSIMDYINPEMFLSRLCKNTFAEYAVSQIRKAKGLNKKISNPMVEERKSILDFCYVIKGQGSVPLKKWLQSNNYIQEKCGLVKIDHMNDIYALFYDKEYSLKFKGVISKGNSNDVALSSVPKGKEMDAILSYNRNAYSAYCKEYKEYWEWVENRNEGRYTNNVAHGKNYDSKNMMQVFRLLDMAEEIALYNKVIVRRPNRDYLLSIKKGDFQYEDLVKIAEDKIERVKELYEKSNLPDEPDKSKIENLLIRMREDFYKKP